MEGTWCVHGGCTGGAVLGPALVDPPPPPPPPPPFCHTSPGPPSLGPGPPCLQPTAACTAAAAHCPPPPPPPPPRAPRQSPHRDQPPFLVPCTPLAYHPPSPGALTPW